MIRIACIGDSITWGFTLLNPGKQSYPALLAEMLGADYTVRNFGFNDAAARFDADTPYVKKRVYRRSLEWNPDIVIIMLGTNDTKHRNWDPEIFLPLKMPILGLYPDILETGVRPAILEISAEKGLEVLDLKDLFTDSGYMMDGVHPQRKGARMLAEAIFTFLNRE